MIVNCDHGPVLFSTSPVHPFKYTSVITLPIITQALWFFFVCYTSALWLIYLNFTKSTWENPVATQSRSNTTHDKQPTNNKDVSLE